MPGWADKLTGAGPGREGGAGGEAGSGPEEESGQGGCAPAHLGSAVGAPQHAKAYEDRVGQPHQDVVHTVHVHELHSSPLHVL